MAERTMHPGGWRADPGERYARRLMELSDKMARMAGEMERDFMRLFVERVQLEARLRRRVPYGGKKGRRAALRLAEEFPSRANR